MLRQWLLSRILTLPNDMPATTLEADRPLKPMTGLLDPRRAEAGTSAGRGPANADASGKHAAAVAKATAAPETYPTIRKFFSDDPKLLLTARTASRQKQDQSRA
jgi:hypothetical protein